jgi:hypothetical protein
MNVFALVVISDGRDAYLEQAMESLRRWVPTGTFSYWRIVDDSGGTSRLTFDGDWDVIRHPVRRGLAAAVQSGWADLPAGVEYVWHHETDFVLVEPLEVDQMAKTLDTHPRLANLVLKRQPGNPAEEAAGGIIECRPDRYRQRDGFVEHQECFSLNPCLIPRGVIDAGWPAGNEAEMTSRLVGEGRTFGFWGDKTDPPRTLHIGTHRADGWLP